MAHFKLLPLRAPSPNKMTDIASKVSKVVVVASEMLQQPPRYAIERGALSVNPQVINALTANATSHTFSVLPPFEDVFWSRYVLWQCTTGLAVNLTYFNYTGVDIPAGGLRLFTPGDLWALAPFPNTQLITAIQASFNSGTVTTQLNDTLDVQLRMCALWGNNSLRFAPHKMDRYALATDAMGSQSAPIAGYEGTVDSSTVPNACGADFWFTDATGNPIVPGAVVGNVTYDASGQPTNTAGIIQGTSYSYIVYLKVKSVEPLWMSPLIFSDVMESGTAITGIKTASFVFNLQRPSAARYLRYNGAGNIAGAPILGQTGFRITNLDFADSFAQSDSKLILKFLTAPLSLPKAPASVIPYMDVPRYPFAGTLKAQPLAANIMNLGYDLTGNNLITIASTVITFQQIPDLLAVFVRPANDDYSFGGLCDRFNQARWLFPILNVNITFNNRSGLLASATQQQLFDMTRANGVRDVDWNMFRGWAVSGGKRVALAGSPILLRPTDWGLDEAMAPGLNGAWSFQITVQCYATVVVPPALPTPANNGIGPGFTPEIMVVPYNSGFFVTRGGESERVMGVLTPAEIIGSATAPYIDRSELTRNVGAGMLSLTQHAPGRMIGWHPGARPTPGTTVGGGMPAVPPPVAAAAAALPSRSALMADRFRGMR